MMYKQLKVFEYPLSPQLASEILNIPVVSDIERPSPKTIGEMVQRSVDLITKTNDQLQQSTIAMIVAKSIMQDLKKRGTASIYVRFDGTVVLRVVYNGEVEVTESRVRRDVPSVRTMNKSSLPYMDALKAEAAALGVDISHLGRQRKAIHELLTKHRAST